MRTGINHKQSHTTMIDIKKYINPMNVDMTNAIQRGPFYVIHVDPQLEGMNGFGIDKLAFGYRIWEIKNQGKMYHDEYEDRDEALEVILNDLKKVYDNRLKNRYIKTNVTLRNMKVRPQYPLIYVDFKRTRLFIRTDIDKKTKVKLKTAEEVYKRAIEELSKVN